MRLIDADAMKQHYPIMENDFGMVFNDGLHKELDGEPTVKAIPKDQYETRLKADMIAMLDEFDLELYEKYEDTDLIKVKYIRQAIQQKIDKLKEVSE